MNRDCSRGPLGQQTVEELGAGFYGGAQGRQGGLWGPGILQRPAGHYAFARSEAAAIAPRANGKIVLAALGFSFGKMIEDEVEATALPELEHRRPELLAANLCLPGADADDLANATHAYWTSFLPAQLATLGLVADDVQAAWCETGRQLQPAPFPTHVDTLAAAVASFAQLAAMFFPNLRLLYLASPHAMHYKAGGPQEPYYFEQGLGIRDAIAAQASGDPALNPDPARGPRMAPVLAHLGRGFWCDASTPRAADGLTWDCPADPSPDGAHPSVAGRRKLARRLVADLANDWTARPWLLELPNAGPGPVGPPPLKQHAG